MARLSNRQFIHLKNKGRQRIWLSQDDSSTSNSQNSADHYRAMVKGKTGSSIQLLFCFLLLFSASQTHRSFLLDTNSVAMDPGLFSYMTAIAGLRTGISEGYSQKGLCAGTCGAKDFQLEH